MASMRSVLRVLLACFLVLAIPVQGLAAAARLSCDMRHADAASHGVEHASPAGSAEHRRDGAPCHDATVKCDACASCAAAATAAIAPSPAPVGAHAASYARIAYLELPHAGESRERLERPPRTSSR